jgi:hypothetical protein
MVSIFIETDSQMTTYSVTVPEKRALSTLVQGDRSFITPMTYSCSLSFCREFLDPVA